MSQKLNTSKGVLTNYHTSLKDHGQRINFAQFFFQKMRCDMIMTISIKSQIPGVL